MKNPIVPADVVTIHLHRGDTTTFSNALVLSVDPQNVGLGGEPALEVVSVAPRKLFHAGTSDWHNALSHHNNVVHISHPEFTGGRVELGYDFTDEPPVDMAEEETGGFVYGAEGQSGAWTDTAPDDPTQSSQQPKGSRKGKKESPLFTLVVNGEQQGDAFPGFTALELLDGSPIIATVVKEGDTLKDGVLVDHVGPGEAENTVQITASKI